MNDSTTFKDKTLMITGGTGSFGNTVLKHFMNTDLAEIRIFSRDEKKQDDMRHRLQEKSPELAPRSASSSATSATPRACATPCTAWTTSSTPPPSSRCPPASSSPWSRPHQRHRHGQRPARRHRGGRRPRRVPVHRQGGYPINAMGKSKAMMESIIYANARNGAGRTTICCTRYGNVMCSRGSVIPLFIDRIRKGEPLTVTDPT